VSDRVLSSQAAKDAITARVENTLRNLTQELTDLREQLNQISTDIFQAGGGS